MQRKHLLSLLVLLAPLSGAVFGADINLGSQARVTALFSYPNTGHSDQTLEQTVALWIKSSLNRDGFPESPVEVFPDGSNYIARISGAQSPAIEAFRENYEAFLAVGDLGFAAFNRFQQSGKGNPDWQFLLPLGEAMGNSKTIEIMDFPPNTLLRTQDYLLSKTTHRWKGLLGTNGVAQGDLDLYSAILDIIPVAAPASDGTKLTNSGAYNGPFNSYTMPLFGMWGKMPNAPMAKPLMAFGAPIRDWFKLNFNVDIQVLGLALVTLPDGTKANVLGANHPSFFYYAMRSASPPNAQAKDIAIAFKVMQQDLIASCWQAEMGTNPQGDPKAALYAATAKWVARDDQVLALTIAQGDFMKPGLAAVTLNKSLEPTDAQLREMENSLTIDAELEK
jgi:hypothetical protein